MLFIENIVCSLEGLAVEFADECKLSAATSGYMKAAQRMTSANLWTPP
jgi:hypothetical protein